MYCKNRLMMQNSDFSLQSNPFEDRDQNYDLNSAIFAFIKLNTYWIWEFVELLVVCAFS